MGGFGVLGFWGVWGCKEECDGVSCGRPVRALKGRKCLGLICNLGVCIGRVLFYCKECGPGGVVICCGRSLLSGG